MTNYWGYSWSQSGTNQWAQQNTWTNHWSNSWNSNSWGNSWSSWQNPWTSNAQSYNNFGCQPAKPQGKDVVFIVAGQSNAVGYNTPDFQSYFENSNLNIRVFNQHTGTWGTASSTGMVHQSTTKDTVAHQGVGFGYSAAEQWAKDNPHDRVHIIPVAYA